MIPDEAVEAAARYMRARSILEAAASHLMAAAWDEGFDKGLDRGEWEAAPVRDEPVHTNPYHTNE